MIVNVVSPEEEYFSGESTMVVTRTPNGEIGIYSGHEATVATILPGGLTIEHSGGKDSYAVSGGLLQITPEKVWSFSLPKFKKLPLVTSTLPVPSSVLIVSVDSMFSVASLLMTDVWSDKLPELLTVRIPALIVVDPEKVLIPVKESVPAPFLVRLPDPLITPEIVSLPESPEVRVIELANSTAPEPCKGSAS